MSVQEDMTRNSPSAIPQGTDDARSAEDEVAERDRASATEAARARVRAAVRQTRVRPLLSDRERDVAMVLAAGFIGYNLCNLLR